MISYKYYQLLLRFPNKNILILIYNEDIYIYSFFFFFHIIQNHTNANFTLLEFSVSTILCTLLLRGCLRPLGVILRLKRSLLLIFSASHSNFSVSKTVSQGEEVCGVFLDIGETFVLSCKGRLPHLYK